MLGLQNYAICWNIIIISQSNDITNAQSLFLTYRKLKFVHLFFVKILENATCAQVYPFVVSPAPELKVELLAHAKQYNEEEGDACSERAIRCEHLECLE